jgi:uncharacterized DUF497 family protein
VPYEWLTAAFADIAKHGIQEYEVLQVLGSQRRLVKPMRHSSGLQVLAIYGRTGAGRLLVVFVRRIGRFDSAIIGAREVPAAEREEFESWESGQ